MRWCVEHARAGGGAAVAVVFDVATSVSSMQSVRVAAEEGRAVPEGAVLDREGRATTNPQAFFDGGLLAPLGSPGAPHSTAPM